MDAWAPLETVDPDIADIIRREEERTRANLELIASENYPSLAVLQAICAWQMRSLADSIPARPERQSAEAAPPCAPSSSSPP